MALADPTRLQVVELLANSSQMSTSDLAELLGTSLSLTCHHLKQLVEVGIVEKRKDGQTKFFSLDREALSLALIDVKAFSAQQFQP